MSRSARSFLALATLLLGCQPSDFTSLADRAPIVAVKSTSPFPSNTFGGVIGSYRTVFPDGMGGFTQVSRLVVGSGAFEVGMGQFDGIVSIETGWTGSQLDLGTQLYAQCAGQASSCPPDTGASLIGVPGAGTSVGCLLAGAPGEYPGATTSSVLLSCETAHGMVDLSSDTASSRLGHALATLPTGTAFGLALASAPGLGATGTVRVLANANTSQPPVLDVTQETLGIPSLPGFGDALATSTLPATQTLTTLASPVLVAASTENASGTARVVVFALGLRDPGTGVAVPAAETLGCLDLDATNGDGSVLALGDVVGDTLPELFVGASTESAATRAPTVRMLSLETLVGAAANGCALTDASDDPATTLVTCEGSTVSCAGSGFGASLAIGDVNADGHDNLLVGAPSTIVGGKANAGAAYVFPGGDTLGASVTLVDGTPATNASLGIALTMLPSELGPGQTPRVEPAVSAPGDDRILVFLCTGLSGDAPTSAAPRCITE